MLRITIRHAHAPKVTIMCAQVDLSKAWLTFSSIVLAFAFIFGNSIRNMYEAVIFLFVVHPFDVGDVLLMGADQTWCKVCHPQSTLKVCVTTLMPHCHRALRALA